MYLTSNVALNKYGSVYGNKDQTFVVSLNAHLHRFRHGMIQFFDVDRNLLSAYPINITIIQSIVDIVEPSDILYQ